MDGTASDSNDDGAPAYWTEAGRALCFAASPTFALLGAVTAVAPTGMAMCGGAADFLPISDMALMYLLMGLFHLSPWLNLFRRRALPGKPPSPEPKENENAAHRCFAREVAGCPSGIADGGEAGHASAR